MNQRPAEPDQKIQALINNKEFAQADQLIKEKLAMTPHNPDAYYLKGVWHYFQGQIKETIENLKKALENDPRHTDAAICLSVLYNDLGKYEEAKKIFDHANRSVAQKQGGEDSGIDKKFAVKHLELADLYMRYRRYDEAIEQYGRAAALDPSNLEVRIRRAKACAKKGFLTRAIQELQQLKAEYPSFLPVRIQLGLLHYSQGNVLDAELEWENVLSVAPHNREAVAYLEMAKSARIKQ